MIGSRHSTFLFCVIAGCAPALLGAQATELQPSHAGVSRRILLSIQPPLPTPCASLLGVGQRGTTVFMLRGWAARVHSPSAQPARVAVPVSPTQPPVLECPMPVARTIPDTSSSMPVARPDSTVVRAVAGTLQGCTNPLDRE